METILNALQRACEKANLPVKSSLVKWGEFEQVTISVITDKPLYNGKIIIQKTGENKFTVTVGNPQIMAKDVNYSYVSERVNDLCDMLKNHHDNY